MSFVPMHMRVEFVSNKLQTRKEGQENTRICHFSSVFLFFSLLFYLQSIYVNTNTLIDFVKYCRCTLIPTDAREPHLLIYIRLPLLKLLPWTIHTQQCDHVRIKFSTTFSNTRGRRESGMTSKT